MFKSALYGTTVIPFGVGIAVLSVAGLIFLALIVWSVIWKGLALWKAARDGSKTWFVILLIVNTLGILEILYIYVFSKKLKAVQQ